VGSSSRYSRPPLHAGSRGGGCRDVKSRLTRVLTGTLTRTPPSEPPGGASGLAALIEHPQSLQIGAVISCEPIYAWWAWVFTALTTVSIHARARRATTHRSVTRCTPRVSIHARARRATAGPQVVIPSTAHPAPARTRSPRAKTALQLVRSTAATSCQRAACLIARILSETTEGSPFATDRHQATRGSSRSILGFAPWCSTRRRQFLPRK
jgi:hypothetical protein